MIMDAMTVQTKRRRQKADGTELARVGKDEMNLAEFPTAILTTRANDGVKTLRFHGNPGELTVTGSDALGLPTPIDNDVLVALIEMTKQKNNFTEAKVNFTRYELIRLTGWANVGSSYERIKESLDRWAGVLLIYEGSWWDNRLKRYVSKTVHIIENILIAEGKTRAEKDGRQQSLPLSSFNWSLHFMESFQANNLKSLDTAFYFSLKLPTSKQLFRFLDKRFAGDRPEWTFNLETLAYEHVGLSRNYSAPKIKEKLGKAIKELEECGFLKPLARDERYFKAAGVWKIRLIDGRNSAVILPEVPPEHVTPPLVEELTRRGVTDKTAAELVRDHGEEKVRLQIEILDGMPSKKRDKVEDPAAWLVAAIRNDHAVPKGFKSKAQREQEAETARRRQQTEAETRRRKHEEDRREDEERKAADAEIAQLSKAERALLEAELLAQASPEERQRIEDLSLRRFRDTFMLGMLREHFAGKRKAAQVLAQA